MKEFLVILAIVVICVVPLPTLMLFSHLILPLLAVVVLYYVARFMFKIFKN